MSLDTLEESFPFLRAEDCADDVQYKGFGVSLSGRDAYVFAAAIWQAQLPMRLKNFAVSEKTLLPADSRSIVSARYKVAFEAPVPPAVLPAQRARIANANLTRTVDGLVPVEARIAATLEVDRTGKVRRFRESLAVDPFAVTATIAHFELLYSRRLSLLEAQGTPGVGSYAFRVRAYWAALRELTRQELTEIVRRGRRESDELRILGGQDDGVTDEEFERWFTGFIIKNFAIGGGFGAVLYYTIKALREKIL